MIIGDDTSETINGTADADSIDAAGGNDTVFGLDGADTIDGGSGGDTLFGGSAADILSGGSENDTFFGGFSTDTVYGGDGDDLIRVLNNEFVDHAFGGAGVDTLDHSLVPRSGDTLDFKAGTITSGWAVGTPEVMSIEIYLDGSGANTIISSGTSGTYHGNAGNDIMVSEDGNETMYGGAGTDTIDHSRFVGNYEFDMVTGLTNVASELFLDFENAIMGAGDDIVTGTTASNSIHGGDGADSLDGAAGDDTLDGGVGSDILFGGDGVDALFGGAQDDTLFGDGDNDALIGGDGADRFFGGAGVNDLMITGDDGAVDHFDGGAGIADVVSYFSSGTGVTVNLANNAANAGAAASETYTGVEGIRGAGAAANTLIGDAGGNVLIGGSAADSISSGAGNDIIYGGDGNDVMDAGDNVDIIRGDQGDDTLTGGGGGDIFKMKGVDGDDTVTDFQVLSDKVEFQVAGVTGFGDLVFQDLGGGDSKVTAGSVTVTFLGVALADIQQAGNFDFI